MTVGSYVIVAASFMMSVREILEVAYACTDLAVRIVYFCTSRSARWLKTRVFLHDSRSALGEMSEEE